MLRGIRLTIALSMICALFSATAGQSVLAQENTPDVGTAAQMVVDGMFSVCGEDKPHEYSDAVYRICTPPWWWISNNELVIWAHGYVDETRPVEIPEDQLCLSGDMCIPDLVNYLGYDFATTSYAVNGLAVVPGIQDLIELVDLFTAEEGPPDRVYLVGASEGGLITTLAVEGYPTVFDGGLATCGPIGDFAEQINYIGDFRVVFDFFYPNLMPGDPTQIPPQLMNVWDTYYASRVYPRVFHPTNRSALKQLVSVTEAPYDPVDLFNTVEISISDLLWYNVFATNNASDVLGGQPFDNADRVYSGSYDDEALNNGVKRFSADQTALDEIETNYQTSGILSVPLVTLHTTKDQLVPYWHEELYLEKTMESGAWPELHNNYPPTETYGHCMFAVDDVLGAFDVLVEMVGSMPLNQAHIDALLAELGPAGHFVQLHRTWE